MKRSMAKAYSVLGLERLAKASKDASLGVVSQKGCEAGGEAAHLVNTGASGSHFGCQFTTLTVSTTHSTDQALSRAEKAETNETHSSSQGCPRCSPALGRP